MSLLGGAVLSALASGQVEPPKAPAAAPPAAAAVPAASNATVTRVYRITQTVTLNDIPEKAKSVRWWVTIPDDDRFQEVLDLAVTGAPGKWSVEREAAHGNRFLYLDLANPGKASLETTVEFTVRRRSTFVDVDPKKVGAITDRERPLFVVRCVHQHDVVAEGQASRVDAPPADEFQQLRAVVRGSSHQRDHAPAQTHLPECGFVVTDTQRGHVIALLREGQCRSARMRGHDDETCVDVVGDLPCRRDDCRSDR
jgi:hypothetical protein